MEGDDVDTPRIQRMKKRVRYDVAMTPLISIVPPACRASTLLQCGVCGYVLRGDTVAGVRAKKAVPGAAFSIGRLRTVARLCHSGLLDENLRSGLTDVVRDIQESAGVIRDVEHRTSGRGQNYLIGETLNLSWSPLAYLRWRRRIATREREWIFLHEPMEN